MNSPIYERRLSRRRIRLLELLPGSSESPIQACTKEASLDDALSFQALSYVWGDLNAKRPITCNSHFFDITVNLHDALLHLVHPHESRLVWADAICINQDDPIERSHQVQLMREIYTRASRVVVWMGKDNNEDTETAISLIGTIHETCVEYAQSTNADLAYLCADDPELLAVRPSSMRADENGWQALRKFYSRPWFTRVWCVQEIILGRDPVCMIDNRTVEWEKVGVAASWLNNEVVGHDFELPEDSPSIIMDIPAFNAHCMHNQYAFDGLLLETLTKFRGFESTDPRDKAYGLLGLVRVGEMNVDYQKSLMQVYEDVVIACIESTSKLTVLSYVSHPTAYVLDGFPSWAPRWDRSMNVSSLAGEEIGWCAGGEEPMKYWDASASSVLGLSGIKFDDVSSVNEVMTMDLFAETWDQPTKHPFMELWEDLGAKADPVGELCQLARSLTAGYTSTWSNIVGSEEDAVTQFYSDFAGFIQRLAERAGLERVTPDPDSFAVVEHHWEQFRIAASRVCDERRFFRTKQGSYGIGPACMTSGDVVVVLRGGTVPYVLRPLKNDFLFLGTCYVDEIMYAQLFSDNENVKCVERVFRLR